jgi:hypothetical protein
VHGGHEGPLGTASWSRPSSPPSRALPNSCCSHTSGGQAGCYVKCGALLACLFDWCGRYEVHPAWGRAAHCWPCDDHSGRRRERILLVQHRDDEGGLCRFPIGVGRPVAFGRDQRPGMGTNTQTGAFGLRDDVAGGTIDVMIPVCGARAGHGARLKQRSFDDCFEVQVSLEWTGTGDVYSFSGEDDYPAGDCIIYTTSGYRQRPASASGTVLVGGSNLAASNSVSSAMSSYTGTTTATCPD